MATRARVGRLKIRLYDRARTCSCSTVGQSNERSEAVAFFCFANSRLPRINAKNILTFVLQNGIIEVQKIKGVPLCTI